MSSLDGEIKKQYEKMSTSNLQGLKNQGQKAMEEYVKSLAPDGHPEELIKANAQDMMNNVNNELGKRGE